MTIVEQVRMRDAVMIFDPVDGFAVRRNVAGPHARPIGTIAYRLLARQQAQARANLDPPLDLAITGTPGGYDVWFGLVSPAAAGANRADLADGDYVVEATSPLYQSLETTVTVPPDPAAPTRLELEPGYAYPFPQTSTLSMGRGPTLLRGTVHRNDDDASALAGIAVDVPGQSSGYRTDATGRWVLVFPDSQPAGPVTVRFTFPSGGAIVDVPNVPLKPGASNALQQTALYGQVLAAGRPARGCAVEVVGRAGQVLTDATGAWLYYLTLGEADGQVSLRATLPDGRAATRGNVPVLRLQANRAPTFRFP